MKRRTNLSDRFVNWYSVFAIILELLFQGCATCNNKPPITNSAVVSGCPKWVVVANGSTNVVELTDGEIMVFKRIVR